MALFRPSLRLVNRRGRYLLVIIALTCGALAQAFAERLPNLPREPLLAIPLFALGAFFLLAAGPDAKTNREFASRPGQSVDVTAFPSEAETAPEPDASASAPRQRRVPERTTASLHDYPTGATEVFHPSTRRSGVIYLAFALIARSAAAAYTGVDLSVLQLACYGIGLGALVQAARAFDRVMPAGPTQDDMPLTHLDALLLTLATVSALIPRANFLDSLPPVTWPDELDYLSNALSLLQGKLVSPFVSGTWDAVYLHAYSIAAAALLVPDNAVALRLVSVVPGVLSVPLQYLFLRELFRNRALAFSASMLFALSSWHVLMSRLGYHWSINGFAELIALNWFARALHTGRPQHFVFSGFGLGLGVLYKYAATLMPLTMMLFAMHQLLFHRQLVSRRLVVGFALLTLSTVIVVGPRVSAIIAHPQMNARVDEMMVLSTWTEFL